jgi:hypothetical protein
VGAGAGFGKSKPRRRAAAGKKLRVCLAPCAAVRAVHRRTTVQTLDCSLAFGSTLQADRCNGWLDLRPTFAGYKWRSQAINFGAAREVKRSHSLTPAGWMFKSFSDTGEYAADGHTAGVSLVNRRT